MRTLLADALSLCLLVCWHHHVDFDNEVFLLSYKAEVVWEIVKAVKQGREPCFEVGFLSGDLDSDTPLLMFV